MSETQDIFLRVHTVVPREKVKNRKSQRELPWPNRILVYDCETLTDATLRLTFGAYRICKLVDDRYLCEEEGLFHADHLSANERKTLVQYVKAKDVYADIEAQSLTPKIRLQLRSRSEFVKSVFFRAIQDESMIVGFNLPFDLARLAENWGPADDGGHSLILRRWHDPKKGGQLREDGHYPRITYTALNSKTALIRSTQVRKIIPEDANGDADKPKTIVWPNGRFLDVRTLLWALRNVSYSLKRACKELKTEHQKKDHTPTGKVIPAEIEYCLWDVKCTVGLLNQAKAEYDLHPIGKRPDQLYSPASVAKGYMDKLQITHPSKKFKQRDRAFGIAMQAYYGGRAECRIRKCEVPVVPVDFMSQYPTVNELLRNWDLLIAESVSFEECTTEIREFLQRITLERCFDRQLWPDFKFFALVRPEDDILPVRSLYNGVTQNIGINYLTSTKPIWYAGPDLIAAIILSDGKKIPHIEKAYRVVAHGKQDGLGSTNLRGMVKVNAENSLYKHVIEQRAANESNKSLHYWLKILANSGSYGLFVELNPKGNNKRSEIEVFAGEEPFADTPTVLEQPGNWFAPPIASLITSGGRLLLAMLESAVSQAGGTYLFCDTDSLAVVASKDGGPLTIPGANGERVLSWDEVEQIVRRFESLNPYNQEIESIRGSILKVHKRNWNADKERRQLYGYSIAGKRYALYEKKDGDIEIIEPKAHALGYFCPPKDSPEHWEKDHDAPKWIFELWDYIVRGALGIRRRKPSWFHLPVMMKITLSTPHHALQNLGKCDLTRPHNFLMMPKISRFGHPPGVNPADPHFTLITPFTSNRGRWIGSTCVNIHDPESPTYRLSLDYNGDALSVSPVNFYQLAESYQNHPEAKSLGADGTPCEFDTCGLLQRAHVVAGEHIPIGKESDRHLEEGEDISLLEFKAIQYQQRGAITATIEQLRRIERVPKREFMRRGVNQHTLEKICDPETSTVRASTLAKVLKVLERWEAEHG